MVTPRKKSPVPKFQSSALSADSPAKLLMIINELRREKLTTESNLADQKKANQSLASKLREAEKIGAKAAIEVEIATMEKYEHKDREQAARIEDLVAEAEELKALCEGHEEAKRRGEIRENVFPGPSLHFSFLPSFSPSLSHSHTRTHTHTHIPFNLLHPSLASSLPLG